MWKYTHTDEMYHSLTNRNNSDGLYHSDVYLGQEFSDGLKHYKYLKKVKSATGKWRYIYDDSELKRNEAISKDVNTQARSKDGYKYVDKKGYTNIKKVKGLGIASSSLRIGTGTEKQTVADKIKEERWNIYQNHNLQKVKDIPKRIISKGAGAVGKALLEMDKKKAKKKVEKKVKTAVKNVENKTNEVKNKVENSLKKKKKKTVKKTYLVNKK